MCEGQILCAQPPPEHCLLQGWAAAASPARGYGGRAAGGEHATGPSAPEGSPERLRVRAAACA